MNKRNIIAAISLIAVAVIAALVVRNRRAQRSMNLAEYQTVPVRRDTLLATVNASGAVKPEERVLKVSANGKKSLVVPVTVPNPLGRDVRLSLREEMGHHFFILRYTIPGS